MGGLKGKHEILFSFITPDSLVILTSTHFGYCLYKKN